MKGVLFVLLLLTVVHSALKSEDGILILTDKNFHEALKTYPKMFVDFYSSVSILRPFLFVERLQVDGVRKSPQKYNCQVPREGRRSDHWKGIDSNRLSTIRLTIRALPRWLVSTALAATQYSTISKRALPVSSMVN